MELIRTQEEEDALTHRLIFSPIRRSKPSRNQQKTAANNMLETITAAGQDGCTARLKFVVRKDDLKQVLEAIRDGRSSDSAASALAVSLDQRLNLLRRRQILRGASHGRDR